VRAKFVMGEVKIGLRRNMTMTFAVMITVAISLTVLGIGLLANSQVRVMKDYWYDKIQVSVFLCDNLSESASCASGPATQAQISSIQSDINALPVVDQVFFETQAQAYQHFQEQFKGSAIAQNVTQDQLPQSFRIKLKDPTKFAVIQSAFSGRPGVDSVQDQHAILDKFFKLLGVLRDGALLIGIFSVLTAALLISNTLRVAAFNRRRETGVMKLVGASSFSIQLPFVLEGIVSTLIGWGFSVGLLSGFKYLIDTRVSPLLSFTRFFTWTDVWVSSAYLLLTGFVVSSIASVVTLRRHLNV
jgi:cell division transport system permease protein